MHGARRVITFCLLTTVLPTVLLIIPLYLRHIVFADKTYEVAESDVIEIEDGISTIFCQEHSLKMNFTFHAFQLRNLPEVTTFQRHEKLKKSFILPDDTWESWGFYLSKGSIVNLTVCSSHRGARVLLVKGERVLRDCNLMEHTNLKGSETLKEEVRGGEGISVFHLQQLFTDSQVVGNNTLKNVHESNTQVTTDKDRYFHHTSNQPTAERINEEFEGEDESDYNTERPLLHRPKQSDVSNNYQSLQYGSDISENDSEMLSFLTSHILNHSTLNFGLTESGNVSSFDVQRKVRHAKSRVRNIKASEMRLDGDKKEFLPGNMKASYKNETSLEKEPVSIMDEAPQNKNMRKSRDLHVMDGGIAHAGNAGNYTEPAEDDESSDSSFENVLFECYGKHYLMKKEVSPSDRCARDSTNITYTLLTQHVVKADGYYHYIFYSDNDLNENVINADFEIYKPVFEYTNYSHSCVNQTECSFSLSFWSDEVVVVEVPRHNNLKNIQEVDDIMYLVSSCYPRMAVYIIFPVAVLFLVLVCAFL